MAIWLLLCALAPLLSGCAGPQKRQYEFYDAFDTVIRLTAYTRDEASFRRLCAQAAAEVLRYDAIFDRYEAHEGVQGVWALNHAQGEATPVEPELLELLLLAQEWYAVCDRVNVAMGAVTDIWHAARESGALPSQEALEAAAAHTDFSLVEVDAAAGTVRLRDPALSLDFGALAREVHLSEAYFRQRFKEVTGLSPVDYRNRRRVVRSLVWLQRGCSVSEAGAQVGWEDANYYARVFKRVTG